MLDNSPLQENMTASDEGPDLQREVQRLLGRCMLRLQQYERLLKTIVAQHELAGPAHSLESIRDARIQDAATKTLGTLIGKLMESYVVADGAERDILRGDVCPDEISFVFRMNIQMAAEDYDRTRDGLRELVDLRNGLVHHFIERFDLWQPDSCTAARHYLLDCYTRIDGHYEQLRSWAEHMEKARRLTASFMQSTVYQDFVVNGIAPDGTVDWAAAGCVSALREATTAFAVGDWASLDDAVDWIGVHYPDQTPEKYGCCTWRQVIHESRRFELRYREEGGRKLAWYRERSNLKDLHR